MNLKTNKQGVAMTILRTLILFYFMLFYLNIEIEKLDGHENNVTLQDFIFFIFSVKSYYFVQNITSHFFF